MLASIALIRKFLTRSLYSCPYFFVNNSTISPTDLFPLHSSSISSPFLLVTIHAGTLGLKKSDLPDFLKRLMDLCNLISFLIFYPPEQSELALHSPLPPQ